MRLRIRQQLQHQQPFDSAGQLPQTATRRDGDGGGSSSSSSIMPNASVCDREEIQN
jgi:hypothetical protein